MFTHLKCFFPPPRSYQPSRWFCNYWVIQEQKKPRQCGNYAEKEPGSTRPRHKWQEWVTHNPDLDYKYLYEMDMIIKNIIKIYAFRLPSTLPRTSKNDTLNKHVIQFQRINDKGIRTHRYSVTFCTCSTNFSNDKRRHGKNWRKCRPS